MDHTVYGRSLQVDMTAIMACTIHYASHSQIHGMSIDLISARRTPLSRLMTPRLSESCRQTFTRVNTDTKKYHGVDTHANYS